MGVFLSTKTIPSPTRAHFNYVHCFAGRLLVLAVSVHAIGYFYKWASQGTSTANIRRTHLAYGLAALICTDVLFFFSLSTWRRRAYNVFITHLVAFITFLVASYAGLLRSTHPLVLYWHKHGPHIRSALSYVLDGAGIYVLDVLLRIVKTCVCTTHIYCLPELCTTRVQSLI
ncbi:hypothetical protein AcV5_003015 [Taiwanofungus camphoratus]|nr:hypothetical protein AcV5_003015 [Antrodia cinnamomea]